MGDLTGCIEDCSAAVTLLEVNPMTGGVGGKKGVRVEDKGNVVGRQCCNMLQTILPATGSEKRKQWLMKTLTRRGVAFSKMEEIKSSNPSSSSSSSSSSSGSSSGNSEEEEEDGGGEGNLDRAVQDFAQACAIDPLNEALKSDLNKLKSFREFKRKQAAEAMIAKGQGSGEERKEVQEQ